MLTNIQISLQICVSLCIEAILLQLYDELWLVKSYAKVKIL